MGAWAGIGCGAAGRAVVRATGWAPMTGIGAVTGCGSAAAAGVAAGPGVAARGRRGRGSRGLRSLSRRSRRGAVRVDRVVGLENGPPRLVDGVLVDLELLVQFVDEPLVRSELSFVRNPDARHLARHAGSPAFIGEDSENVRGEKRPHARLLSLTQSAARVPGTAVGLRERSPNDYPHRNSHYP